MSLFGTLFGDQSRPTTPPKVPITSSLSADPRYGLMLKLLQNAQIIGYDKILIPFMYEQYDLAHGYTNYHPDDQLLRTAKHTCTRAWVKQALQDLDVGNAQKRSKGYSEEDITLSSKGVLVGIALVLVQGFDKVQSAKLTRDLTGRYTGTTDQRFPQCDAALKSGEQLGGKSKRRRFRKKNKTLRRKRNRNVH